MTQPKNDDVARANYLNTLLNLKSRSLEIDWQIRQVVRAAVHEGATWREVGASLGVSGQAAWARYGYAPTGKISPQKGGTPIND